MLIQKYCGPLWVRHGRKLTLEDFFALLPDNDWIWSCFEFYGVGRPPEGIATMEDFSRYCLETPEGYRMTWQDLRALSLFLGDVTDCILVASDTSARLQYKDIEWAVDPYAIPARTGFDDFARAEDVIDCVTVNTGTTVQFKAALQFYDSSVWQLCLSSSVFLKSYPFTALF